MSAAETKPMHVEGGSFKGCPIRTARKAGKCAGFRHCGTIIQPGDRYVEGDTQYDIAGGFGHERLCLPCAGAATAAMTFWSGGEQPVPDNVLVEVELRSGIISPPVWASEVHWKHGICGITEDDIVGFRVARHGAFLMSVDRPGESEYELVLRRGCEAEARWAEQAAEAARHVREGTHVPGASVCLGYAPGDDRRIRQG
jgi:hypothetical protein